MKRILNLALIIWLISCQAAWAATFVNVTTGTNDGSAASLAATAASHTTGNLIVVYISADGAGGNGAPASRSCADTATNTYTAINSEVHSGTNDQWGELYYAKNITGHASNVITCSWTADRAFRRIIVLQYSGSDITAPLEDGSNDTAEGSGTTVTSTSMTSAGGAVFVACGAGYSGGTAWAPNANYTERAEIGPTDTFCMDRITATTLTQAPGATQDAPVEWIINGAVFKDVSAATRRSIAPIIFQ